MINQFKIQKNSKIKKFEQKKLLKTIKEVFKILQIVF